MKDYKAEYLDLKSRLTDIMGEIAVYYQDNGMEKKVGIIDNLRQKLEENEFSIVVVGEFSAGKSTFLNALMGKNILPTLGNEFITLVKETSIVSFVGAVDLCTAFKNIGNSNYEYMVPYTVMALVYIVLVLIITVAIRLMEKRLRASDKR